MVEIKEIPVGKIVVTGDNPRQDFDLESLKALGESIVSHGLLQPIIVRPKEDYYELVVGERRLKAAQILGLEKIEAKILDVDDPTCTELRLIENTQREDLSDAEKGDAVYALIERYPERYPTIAEVARAINKPYDTILKWTQKSRRLSNYVRELTAKNAITDGHAYRLLKYDHATQDKLADAIVKNEIPTTLLRKFLELYEANPNRDLDELAMEAKGVKKVEVEVAELPKEARKAVEKIAKEREKRMEEARKKALEKAKEARKQKLTIPKEELEAAAKLVVEELKEEKVREALEKRLRKERERQLKVSREEEVVTPALEEIQIPYAVKSKLEKSIKEPSRQVVLAKAMVEHKLDEWGRGRLIELARNAPWASVDELVKMVKDEGVRGTVLMLEIDPKQRKALYTEMEKRGEEKIKDVVKVLLNERLEELGYCVGETC